MNNEYLECGIIVGVHGVRGAVKAESWCDSPKVLASQTKLYTQDLRGGYREYNVLGAFVNGPAVVLTLEGIESREDAISYKGRVLYLHRSAIKLKPGEMFVADMIGLAVVDADNGRVYGEIAAVSDGVQGKLYTVKTPAGEVIYPSGPNFVRSCSAESGLLITPIPGFFD